MISREGPLVHDITRQDIDELTILQATEILADYCLTGQEESTSFVVTKMIVVGLYVAVGMTRDEGSNDPNERWVYRMRLSSYREPFRAYTGLDVWLPYGTGTHPEYPGDGELAPVDKKSRRSGVFVSYAEGQEFWNIRELRPQCPERPYDYWRDREKSPFDLLANTVGQVDQSLIADTEAYNKPGIGFILKEAVSLVDEGFIGLALLEHKDVIDLGVKRRKISEVIADILFV